MKMSNYYLTRSEIMTKAQEMTAEALRRWPGQDRRATLTVCLRQAWADARQPQTIEQFRALTGEKQLDLLRMAAAKVPARAARKTRPVLGPDGQPVLGPDGRPVRQLVGIPASIRWMIPESDGGLGLATWAEALDTIANEAWIALDRIDSTMPLGIILARATDYAAQRLSRMYQDKPARGSAAVSLDDPDYTGAVHYPSPEPVAVLRESIRTAARTEQDRAVLDLQAQGYTHPEIARALGISRQGVEKHLRKMQTRMQDARTAADADALDAAVMRAAGVRAPRARTWTPDNASSGSSAGALKADITGKSRPAGPVNGNRERAAAEAAARKAAEEAAKAARAAKEAEQAAAWADDLARSRAAAERAARSLDRLRNK